MSKDSFTRQSSDNSYINRLRQSGHTATAHSDIYNQDGTLLLCKGESISDKRASLLSQHRLVKPIEISIELSDQIKPVHIARQLRKLLDSAQDLSSLDNHWRCFHHLVPLLTELQRHTVLLQKLTLMQEQLPEMYQQTLFSCWLSIGLAQQMGLGKPRQLDIMLAAFSHDLGMLNLDPDVARQIAESDSETLSPDLWRQLQAHPLLGYSMLIQLNTIPKEVAIAVLQHHERFDGTGYPKARHGEELRLESQLLSFGDALYAIRFNNGQVRHLRELLPVLQVNRGSQFHPEVSDAAMVAIRQGCCRLPASQPAIDHQQLISQISVLQQFSQQLDTIAPQLRTMEQLRPRIIYQCTVQFQTVLRSAGLKNADLMGWIRQAADSSDWEELSALGELGTMVRELRFTRRRILREVASLLQSDSLPARLAQSLRQVLTQAQTKEPAVQPHAAPESEHSPATEAAAEV